MLKRDRYNQKVTSDVPAAFRRLCVETELLPVKTNSKGPAAFRRLCVETVGGHGAGDKYGTQPPSGGCVLKRANARRKARKQTPAAFRRLCVET